MYRRIKRGLDLLVAILLYALWTPLSIVLLRIPIRLGSYGHSLLKQERVGLNGQKFTIFKLRTMYSNANEIGRANGIRSHAKPKGDDPRVTPLGKFLRKTSIDEFPQLLNIIRGEMSFIGPRPPQPHEMKEWRAMYGNLATKRLEVLPGLTGWAQVNGRDALTPKQRLEHDAYYVENQSFWLDLMILIKTIPTLFKWESAN
ncbi:hypothetical protein A2886_01010 [candidate division WWE3 bacterium RIFCSPHIGHO2_01_FULL_42_13]|uniref:Bacterial sugar transferase domain-containing protein n=1 Tax=candidate division WWE3 bacterium RIFCSPHIGHO2_01_FULL_42_13 TaxID=1802617 RepID=A0A1F4UQY7_UNCKA|nr:MAG: hypothetical protein A2886_01010 [candidate division WWE3 bacterium RIFCSPHIGHO2_01_FULL_42_13]